MRSNTISQLSNPQHYDGIDFHEQMEQAMDIFYNTFLEKSVKPEYNNKPIFFDMNKSYRNFTLPFPERFLHIVSMGKDDDQFSMYPCQNDSALERCETLCEKPSDYSEFQLLDRKECLYRLERIHYIKQVIDFANKGNSHITQWEQSDKDSRGQRVIKRFIRYHYGIDDYIIVFRDQGKNYYLLTAYPVVTRSKKEDYDKQYLKYISKKTE